MQNLQARLNLTQNLSVKSAKIVAKFRREPASRAAKIKISFKISPFPPSVSLDQYAVVTLRSYIAPVNLLKINRKRGAPVSASAAINLLRR